MVYRILAKRGYDLVTGILMENDIDRVVAQSLGAICLIQENVARVSDHLVTHAMDTIDSCDLVVDAGFKVTPLNHVNLDLLNHALDGGKPVFALDKGELRLNYGRHLDMVWTANQEIRLVELLENYLAHTRERSA